MMLIYENSFDGFLTGIFEAFKHSGAYLMNADELEGDPFLERRRVACDLVRADRVSGGMARLGFDLERRVYFAWLSRIRAIDGDILETLRLGFARNSDPLAMLYEAAPKNVASAFRKVGHEAERGRQFVRFKKAPGGIYVADLSPIYDILPLIGPHFHERFSCQRFIIRDLVRGRAVVSDENGWRIVTLPEENAPLPEDSEFEELWRRYFSVIAIRERENKKLQQKFVPLRYRGHLTEFEAGNGGR